MKPQAFQIRLQALLDDADISAYRLSQLSGITKQTISRYLSGHREPTFFAVLAMARAMNVSLSVFDNVTEPQQ